MKPADFQNLLHRYQQGTCTPEEKRAVERWYEGLNSADEQLELSADEQALLKATLWQRIIGKEDAPAGAQPWWRVGRYAAAAAIVLGVGIWQTSLRPGPMTPTPRSAAHTAQSAQWLVYDNATRQPRTLTLADKSTVTLAPASQLKYPAQFRGARRTVYLVGEAFFTVSHNPARPFLVYTDKVVTTVLGTSFTVRAYAAQPEAVVLVKTGRVRVTPRVAASAATAPAAKMSPSLVVLPNQQATYRADRHELTQALVARPALLTPHSFVFDDQPVAAVLAVLEEAYGVPIVYDKVAFAACTVTLKLGNEPLYEKLDILCKILGASYEKTTTHILLHPGKC
ncbi:FecR family protein [Hymenobacter elongatus]|uniref:FecR family protein n=1 Tax=Hymenobacter elongatus TaxID=877208 RepID=A0A4Z0PGH5_9BACT|nr:FecR family protein [Hymenobacter elongatus]TGE14234.1 FecR family protein [Hymenobacter elongatus]